MFFGRNAIPLQYALIYNIGVEICYPHSIWNIELFSEFLEEVNSPNMCCLFDIVGMLDAKNVDKQYEILDSYLETFRDKIRLIHIKDMDIINGKRTIVPVGTGLIDFEYMFKKIDENICAVDMIVESVNSEYVLDGIEFLKKYL